ncbi:MAG: hypothetical protein UR68_C0001G0002 [Candidatus Roizmanbacteria bacterium GW2011_GWA2_35_19]|uniref:Uncharacterized protein n=2 Tax=Candidatus Roizmaniibacteriota TaxID=1752723 RepID=A0A0G0F4K4_9BACT|nr:MAG: hypothetical protein UR63_C0001G0002 [Candidatus Roizmanbacteria bacterium GW2011_GWC2_35_12]KKP74402.1 MAG: hypothetical protein UR68_C0001G0002 [Candidatus Roizmanbacteria bacterium GW2011_GWA2_35_19]
MEIDKQTIFKYLALFGLIATIFLLVSFQFLFAIIVLIVAIASWLLSKKENLS